MTAPCEVNASDRTLAADWIAHLDGETAEAQEIRAGENDGHEVVQVFARRRIAAETWEALS